MHTNYIIAFFVKTLNRLYVLIHTVKILRRRYDFNLNKTRLENITNIIVFN